MRKWNNREIEQSLSRAVLSGKPDVYGLLAQPSAAQQERALVLVPDLAPPVHRRSAARRALAACACLFLLCGAGLWSWFATAASITIEINPSFLLTANRFDRVLSIEAQNEDAAAVLDGLTLRYAKLDDALAALSESMLRHDLLTPASTVRVTVTGPRGEQAEQLAQRVTADIRAMQPQAPPADEADKSPAPSEPKPETTPKPDQPAAAPSITPPAAPAPSTHPSSGSTAPAPRPSVPTESPKHDEEDRDDDGDDWDDDRDDDHDDRDDDHDNIPVDDDRDDTPKYDDRDDDDRDDDDNDDDDDDDDSDDDL